MTPAIPVRLSLAFAVLALLIAAPLSALENEDFGFNTTEDLYQVCSAPADAAESVPAAFACRGFIEATVQYHDAVSDRRKMKRLICYPDGLTIAEGRDVFVAWAEANRDDATLMGEQPVLGLVRALGARYPCP